MTHVVFVTDPIATFSLTKDSTLAMLWAAQRRGWNVSVLGTNGFTWRDGRMLLALNRLELKCSPDQMAGAGVLDIEIQPIQHLPANDVDLVMMRKDPPFDMDYINATYMLEQVENEGVLVVNKAQSLRDCNEKYYTTAFPELAPSQVISSDAEQLLAFHAKHEDVVFKPLDGMGGKGIFRVRKDDPNVHVIIESLTRYGKTAIVGQRFLPEITAGDKRILLIDGQPVSHAIARIPKAGESRGNLAAGGTGVAQPLTQRDQEIAAVVGPDLVRRGLVFAGIDVIGDFLTEINVTCPTCIRELDRACGLDIAMDLLDCIAQKLDLS